MSRHLLLAALLAVACSPLWAQTEPALDAEALLVKVEAKLYSPKAAGLTSVKLHVSMPMLDPMLGGGKIMFYWQAAKEGAAPKDKSAIKIEGGGEMAANPMIAGMIKKIDMGFGKMFSGGATGSDLETIRKHATLSATESEGKYILTIKRKADAPEDVFLVDSVMTISKEYVVEKAIAKVDDQLTETTPVFKALEDGKLLTIGYKMSAPLTGENEIAMVYEQHDKLWLPAKIVNKIVQSGMEVELLFKDYEINKEIDPKVFEDEGKDGGK